MAMAASSSRAAPVKPSEHHLSVQCLMSTCFLSTEAGPKRSWNLEGDFPPTRGCKAGMGDREGKRSFSSSFANPAYGQSIKFPTASTQIMLEALRAL